MPLWDGEGSPSVVGGISANDGMGVSPDDAVQCVIGREKVGPTEAGDMRGKAVIEEGTTGADREPCSNNTGGEYVMHHWLL